MKKCYIGVGGVGCRILNKYELTHMGLDSKFIYFDSNSDNTIGDKSCKFVFNDYLYGTGCSRTFGKEVFRKNVYINKIPRFFDEFFSEDTEIVYITTTFGGFGSAVIFELADYIGANIKNEYPSVKITSKIFALPEKVFEKSLFMNEEEIIRHFKMNSIGFMEEYHSRQNNKTWYYSEESMYIVFVKGLAPDDYQDILDYDDEKLKSIDIKTQYLVGKANDNYDVFISYSSLDQTVADALAEEFEQRNISYWIANKDIQHGAYAGEIVKAIKNSKVFVVIISKNSISSQHVVSEIERAFARLCDGLTIMPFLIDDTPYSYECEYYLSRQQSFAGQVPPLEEKINKFTDRIQKVLASR